MRSRALLPVLLLVLVPAAGAGNAGTTPDDGARRKAIRRGIAYLDDHLFRLPRTAGTPRDPFTYAVAGLVHLMNAETRTGPSSASPVTRIRDHLVDWIEGVSGRATEPGELPEAPGQFTSERLVQYTWPVAMTAWFLAELDLRGMETPATRKALERCVTLLVDAQQENGGWGHHAWKAAPEREGRERLPDGVPPEMRALMRRAGSSYPTTLVSASNVVAIALGIVDATGKREALGPCLDRARAYFRAAQIDNGSFPYDPSQRSAFGDRTAVGRTAGALFAWHCLAMPRDRAFRDATEYLLDNLEWIPEGHGSPCLNDVVGALACRLLGEEPWARFRALHETAILEHQADEGWLDCICRQRAFGVTCDSPRDEPALRGLSLGLAEGQRCYDTALHLFVLLLDRGNLKTLDRIPEGRDAPTTPRERSRR